MSRLMSIQTLAMRWAQLVLQVLIADNYSLSGAPTVTLSSGDSVAAETTATVNLATLTLTRLGSSASPLSVGLMLDGNAASGVDFGALAATVVIPAGQLALDLSVTPIDDA